MTASGKPGWWQRNRKSLLVQLALFLLVAFGIQAWQTRHMASGQAPDVTIQRALSPQQTLSLADWRQQQVGGPVVLYFWASWCTICRLEQPMINGLIQSQPVLPIAMQSGPASQVLGYERQHGLNWNSVVDPDGSMARHFGVSATPSFVVLDAQGNISSTTVGLTSPWGLRLRLWRARLAG